MRLLAWLALVLCGAAAVTTRFRDVRVDADRGGLIVDSFGVYVGSVFEATICSINAATGVPGQLSVIPRARLIEWTAEISRIRQLSLQLCAAPALFSAELSANGSCTRLRHVFVAPEQVSVLAMLCGPGSLTLRGEAAVTNPSLGTAFTHLSLDQAGMPGLSDLLLAFYVTLLITWIVLCMTYASAASRLHVALGVVVALRAIEAAADCIAVRALGATGNRFSASAAAAGILQTMSTGAFLVVLLAAGFGWAVTRVTLTRREYAALAALLLAYSVMGIMKATCSEGTCSAFTMLEYVVRSMEMLATIVALNYQVATLRLSIEEDDIVGPTTASTYALIAAFERLRWAFAAYVLLPPLLVVLRISAIAWTHEWVLTAMQEALHAWVYVAIGVAFCPDASPAYEIVASALKEWHAARQPDASQVRLHVAAAPARDGMPDLWSRIRLQLPAFMRRPDAGVERVASSASSASSELTPVADDVTERRALAAGSRTAERDSSG